MDNRERIIHGGKIMPVFLVIESKQTQKSEERWIVIYYLKGKVIAWLVKEVVDRNAL